MRIGRGGNKEVRNGDGDFASLRVLVRGFGGGMMLEFRLGKVAPARLTPRYLRWLSVKLLCHNTPCTRTAQLASTCGIVEAMHYQI